ncbi:MAG: hypothetical protein II644_00400 [Paludibacteraceae bacterium]|nr:hypothetical protein [Paludibacteraceae bacterium]
MKRLIQLVVAAMLIAVPAQAVKRYACDFESEAARNRWVINPTANSNVYNQLKNKWYIGAPGNNDHYGNYGLYISDDGGQTAHYTAKGCWVFAYDTVSLDNITGDYTLSFDYTAMGNVASNFDGLYVLWIPMLNPEENLDGGHDSIKVLSIPTSSGTLPSNYENYVLQLQPTAGMDYVNGTATWRQCAVKIRGSKCDGTPHYLAFVWANGGNQAQQPGGMVDNINITDQLPCDPVSGLTVTPNGTTVSLSWTGAASEYEVSAYSYETNTWSGPKTVQTNQTQFSNLPIGQTDFIVRAKCSEYEYSLKTIVSKLIYYPDLMCVDYLNLANATCYVHNSSPSNTLTFDDFRQVPAVDYGPSDIRSRHVVHFDRQETEPRTGGLAKTIPDGELASVRLGNWDSNDEAERIEFTFDVDTIKYPVLLLKYMPLLEAPGHDDHENPRFKLDMLIETTPNNFISIGRCGMADFNCNDVYAGNALKPGAAAQGWHITKSSVAQTSADVVWKEWTTVGVNLRKPEYRGKKLKVRLTTHDCTFSVHSGYAYFTLGCSDGKLKGMKCGEINETFEAPDGFDYRWAYAYNEKFRRPDGSLPDEYILGTGQTYTAGPQDDSLYVVDCMFVQDHSCFFSLYASTLATNPVSVMARPKIVRNCRENIYQVKLDASKSWVQEIDHVKADTIVSKNYHIESYEWTIEEQREGGYQNWSDEVSPTFNIPIEGGDFVIKLRTTCGTCDSVVSLNLHLEPLGPTHETRTIVLCDEDRKAGYVWNERPDTVYHTYTTDSVVLANPVTSCDSVIVLQLVEPLRILEDTMLLPEDLPYTRHGRVYPVGTTTMIDTIPSPLNCGITWVFNLEIYESLQATPVTSYVLCEGDPVLTLAYDITRGRSLSYTYTFADPLLPSITPVVEQQKKGHYEIPVSIDPTLYPNVYEGVLLLEDAKPEFSLSIPFTLTMQYASSVIAQRWNDVLAIRNADFNGGYQFDSVQWYVNGQPIEGATDFNYYTGGDGAQLRFGEEYTALLTRSDGVKLFTCPFVPAPVAADVTDMPSLVPPSSPLHISAKGTAVWYDALGRRHHSDQYDHSDIITPGTAGYYLLVLQSGNNRSIHQIVVR